MKPLLRRPRLVTVEIELRTNIPLHRLVNKGSWTTAIQAGVGWKDEASFELTKPVKVRTKYLGNKKSKLK